jgi:predicted SAM-dependent methyltransferase
MTGLRDRLRRLTRVPGVPQTRYLAERSVTPHLREQVHQLGIDHGLTVERLAALEQKVDIAVSSLAALAARLDVVETHQPAILNAISSSNGTARVLARRVDDLIETTAAADELVQALRRDHGDVLAATDSRLSSVEDHLRAVWDRFATANDELQPQLATIAFLLRRVETVRAEMLNELRYGGPAEDVVDVEPKIVNHAAIEAADLRLNLGAGHIPLEGFVNVDMRELPGIDVVAPVDNLPFQRGALAEIFSSHTVEHFPEIELRRRLLPYWFSMLRPGGVFRAVVPDLDAMSAQFVRGEISFDSYRAVVYGGQEYEGDFHYTGFTPESLGHLLADAGFQKVEVLERGRPNGDCLEFEIVGTRPPV